MTIVNKIHAVNLKIEKEIDELVNQIQKIADIKKEYIDIDDEHMEERIDAIDEIEYQISELRNLKRKISNRLSTLEDCILK